MSMTFDKTSPVFRCITLAGRVLKLRYRGDDIHNLSFCLSVLVVIVLCCLYIHVVHNCGDKIIIHTIIKQKTGMRYAFLKEPKTPLGKLVAGAWRKFKDWWNEHKREAVEKKARESVLGKLAELKKETAEQPRKPIIPKKNRGPELE